MILLDATDAVTN